MSRAANERSQPLGTAINIFLIAYNPLAPVDSDLTQDKILKYTYWHFLFLRICLISRIIHHTDGFFQLLLPRDIVFLAWPPGMAAPLYPGKEGLLHV